MARQQGFAKGDDLQKIGSAGLIIGSILLMIGGSWPSSVDFGDVQTGQRVFGAGARDGGKRQPRSARRPKEGGRPFRYSRLPRFHNRRGRGHVTAPAACPISTSVLFDRQVPPC